MCWFGLCLDQLACIKTESIKLSTPHDQALWFYRLFSSQVLPPSIHVFTLGGKNSRMWEPWKSPKIIELTHEDQARILRLYFKCSWAFLLVLGDHLVKEGLCPPWWVIVLRSKNVLRALLTFKFIHRSYCEKQSFLLKSTLSHCAVGLKAEPWPKRKEEKDKCFFFNPLLPVQASWTALSMREMSSKTMLFPSKEPLVSGSSRGPLGVLPVTVTNTNSLAISLARPKTYILIFSWKHLWIRSWTLE